MTGPAEGKIEIPADFIVLGEKINSVIYIHLKGFSRARVTHLDIEGFEARGDKITGGRAIGTSDGITIILSKYIEIDGKKTRKLIIKGIKILEEGKKARCVVGIKEGGIFIGFESSVLSKLEEIGYSMMKSEV